MLTAILIGVVVIVVLEVIRNQWYSKQVATFNNLKREAVELYQKDQKYNSDKLDAINKFTQENSELIKNFRNTALTKMEQSMAKLATVDAIWVMLTGKQTDKIMADKQNHAMAIIVNKKLLCKELFDKYIPVEKITTNGDYHWRYIDSDKTMYYFCDSDLQIKNQPTKPCKTPCVQCGSLDHDTLECKVKYVPVLKVGETARAIIYNGINKNTGYKSGQEITVRKNIDNPIYCYTDIENGGMFSLFTLEFIRPESPEKPEQSAVSQSEVGTIKDDVKTTITTSTPRNCHYCKDSQTPMRNESCITCVKMGNGVFPNFTPKSTNSPASKSVSKPKREVMRIGDTCFAIRKIDNRKILVRKRKIGYTYRYEMVNNIDNVYTEKEITIIPGTIKKGKK